MFLAIDTETTGLGYFDTPFCVSMAWRGNDGSLQTRFIPLDSPEIAAWVERAMFQADELIFHNPKFDIQKLELIGIKVMEHKAPYHIHDTECLSHLLNEQRPKRLKYLAKELLGEETDEAKVIATARRKLKLTKADGYDALPREIVEPYAIKDAEFTLRLFELLYPQLDDELRSLYAKEQELMVVFYDMERAGMGLDVEYLQFQAREYASAILATDILLRDLAGENFNPNSPVQVKEALRLRGIEVEGTKKAILGDLDDEVAQAILKLRTLSKIHGTYLKGMLAEQRDGVIHPNFKQFGTRGRRTASGSSESD